MKNIITRIEAQKNNKNRVNIYIDEEYALACSTELVYFHGLKKGMEVKLEYLNEIVKDDNYLKCKNYALKFIEKTFKTENEIINKLTQRGYDSKSIEKTIVFLKEYKFVDDNSYSDMFIKQNITRFGKKKIKYKLLRKGINEETIDEKLNNISEDYEMESAFRIAEKKFNSLIKKESNSKNIYKKIGNLLLSNGYSFEIVNRILSKVVDNERINKVAVDQKINTKNVYEESIEDQYTKVKNVAQKRYNIIIKSENDSIKIYRRLYSYLLRRGYDNEIVKKVIKEIIWKFKLIFRKLKSSLGFYLNSWEGGTVTKTV